MTITKKEYSALDAPPAILYAKRTDDVDKAYPVLLNAAGELIVANTVLTNSVDGATTALKTITYEHHEVHNSSHYFVSGVQTLAINEVLDFTFQTPNTTKWTHFLWKITTESETAWYVYETVVATSALANAITPYNNNRNSLNISGNVLKYELQASLAVANADTNVTAATLLETGISGAGKEAGNDVRDRELILKQNTVYCLRAVATAAGYVDFLMEFYEHTNT